MTLRLILAILIGFGSLTGQTKSKAPFDSGPWTPELVLNHLSALIDANDKRYLERFEAGDKAVLSALAAQKELTQSALVASKEAVSVAQVNGDSWRAGANEWRAAMNDRERQFASQTSFDALKERIDRMEGQREGVSDLWGWIIAAVMTVVAILSLFVRPNVVGIKK